MKRELREAHDALDALGVPRNDGDKELRLIARIGLALERNSKEPYFVTTTSTTSWTDNTGLMYEESMVMSNLVNAWNNYCKLESTDESADDFLRAINSAQRILAARALHRNYPDYWNY